MSGETEGPRVINERGETIVELQSGMTHTFQCGERLVVPEGMALPVPQFVVDVDLTGLDAALKAAANRARVRAARNPHPRFGLRPAPPPRS